MSAIDEKTINDFQKYNGLAVPQKLKYSSVLPVAIPTQSTTRAFSAGAGPWSYNGHRGIRIPLNTDQSLSPTEGYLRFTVRNASVDDAGAPAGARLDGSAYSCFSRMRTESSDGTTIDDIDQFGALMNTLSDYQLGADWRGTTGHMTAGYSQVTCGAGDNTVISYDRHAQYFAAGALHTFCIPLIGILGINKCLPLKYVTGGGMILELIVAQGTEALTVDNDFVPGFEITRCDYVAKLMSFNSDFDNTFKQVIGMGGVQLHVPTYRHQTFAIGVGASWNAPIAIRARSIKSILAIQRITPAANPESHPLTSGRDHNAVTDYQFTVGNVQYPPRAITISPTNVSEVMSEIHKSLGTLHAIDMPGTVVTRRNYLGTSALAAAAAAANEPAYPAEVGKACLGFDFENFPGSGLESGLNTSDHSLPITLNVNTAGHAVARVDVWVMMDQVVTLNPNGILSVAR